MENSVQQSLGGLESLVVLFDRCTYSIVFFFDEMMIEELCHRIPLLFLSQYALELGKLVFVHILSRLGDR